MRDFHLPGRSAVFAENGMCATSHPLVAQVALDMLKRGGNAMDAAIAAAALLGLCEPAMAGLGGDCFVLFSPAESDAVLGVNGSGRAPAAIDEAGLLRAQGHATLPLGSVHAITMPGAVDAICCLSQRWGKLGLAAVLAPAIDYAEKGVPVAPRVHFDWQLRADRLQGAARRFFLAHGEAVPAVGARFRAPQQAEVLRRIARQGREGFYSGEVAEDIVNTLRALGGTHRQEDLAAVRCEQSHPVSSRYRGAIEVWEHPPNSQGITALLLLNILSCFDMKPLVPFGLRRLHIEAEATKLAMAMRDRLVAEPDMGAGWQQMLDPKCAAALAAQIQPDRVLPPPAAPQGVPHSDTAFLTVVDRDRMAVSWIQSLYYGFGSGIASEKFGILLHNRGCGFSLRRGHPNAIGGAKRPMHTIIPAMARQNGRVSMAFGVMGGPYQPTGHARLLSNLCDYGMDLQAALDAPRSFADAGCLHLERGHDAAVMAGLRDLGHRVVVPEVPLGGAQAIQIMESGVLVGASDARKDGQACGY
ncbi:MAG: gamma-glutamyltransferase family protein [Rhodobacteraceae bacterium]|nr:gamma-glutamyltransferase family protein [Paracoccaceae bacterium]